jgi:hypothetical protein
MEWENSPPVFSTVLNLVNACIRQPCGVHPIPGPICIASNDAHTSDRDPSLLAPPLSLVYTDDYVNDFMRAAKHSPVGSFELDNQRHVQHLLLLAVDDVFSPLSTGDSSERQEPVSLKKHHTGNCSWALHYLG